jgi:tRNA modification GTPase
MSHNDTIVAQATPPGRGGVGILRISGQKAREVAEAVLGKLPKPRYADYLPFKDSDGSALDQGIALWFPGPNSFTGEDVLELQGHGGPVILDLLLKRILTLPGLRIAKPGEFSERAFLNDKLDLAQAEAIADLIDASSEQAARSALNSLQGAFSARVNHLVEALTHLRIYVEAAIDFPDEEIDFLSDGKIEAQLNNVMADLDAVRAEARQGSLLREGMKVVIAGRPNAGKSSLLNALAGREAAIVTDIAGTTRDVLREHIHIDGMPLHIIDTAGLRDASDEVEQTMMATLVRYHRKAVKLDDMPRFTLFKKKQFLPLIQLLRLGVLLNNQRQATTTPPTLTLTTDDNHWTLSFPHDWFSQNALVLLDLEREQQYWSAVTGWCLKIEEEQSPNVAA